MSLLKLLSKAILLMVLASPTAPGPKAAQPDEKEFLKIPAILTAKPRTSGPNDHEIWKLQIRLYNERAAITSERFYLFRRSSGQDCQAVLDAARRLKSVGLEISKTAAEKEQLLSQMLELCDRVSYLVSVTEQYYRQGQGHPDTFLLQLNMVRELRLETQIELARLIKLTSAK